jgi:hypothetical protein
VSKPQLGGSRAYIYVPQWQGGPVILPRTGFHFRRLPRFAEPRWRYSEPPPHGDLSNLSYINHQIILCNTELSTASLNKPQQVSLFPRLFVLRVQVAVSSAILCDPADHILSSAFLSPFRLRYYFNYFLQLFIILCLIWGSQWGDCHNTWRQRGQLRAAP